MLPDARPVPALKRAEQMTEGINKQKYVNQDKGQQVRDQREGG